MLFSRTSLKRSPRIRTRKTFTSADVDIVCPPSRGSSLACRKSRPPPLQNIPELSENMIDNATHSPTTARPLELVSSRITLSAYTFSIDDALLMLGSEAPLSPALSASSSTSGDASSEDVPATPRTSDDDDVYDFTLPTSCLRPQHISIRPLCILKTGSLICQEDEDVHSYCEKENIILSSTTEEMREQVAGTKETTEGAEEAELDFYTRELEDFVSFLPANPLPTAPARRDSLILVADALPAVTEVARTKPRGRSRHSKPLPLLPPATPPLSTFPSISTFPLVQTTAHNSLVRRKRNNANHSPAVPRPLPRMSIPLDIDDCVFAEESIDVSPRESLFIEHVEEDPSTYSRPSFISTASAGARPLPPAIPETPLSGMYGEVALPRSSTDSGAPRSSVESTVSSPSPVPSNAPLPSFSFPSSYAEERLCSRWSTSTLGSLAVEPPRSTALFLPLKSVFSSRTRRVLPPPQKLPLQSPPKAKHCTAMTRSPLCPKGKHIRQQGSRSSTSSAGTSSSESDSHDGSPTGLRKMPIPVAMFLRAT